MAFDNTKLSYFHSFSKMPAQNSTSLGNAINKSGHTVTASEVWSQDIPYYGKMGSLADVITKVQPYARKNDMCYITAGDDKGKTFQYDGEGNWTDITTTLVDGALIKNANDDVVLLYHKGQTLTNLTADNNANTDSADNAARLWAKRAKDGSQLPEGETRLIEQFVAPTDKALNGLASVAYAPVIANGSLVSGTGYYDYCFSGTILWATARTASTLIDCFEYVGGKVSDVVDTVASHASTIATHTSEISELKEKLGIEDDDNPDSGSTPTLGGRVTALEDAVETLNGDATTEGSIAKSIKDAIDNLGDVAVKDDIKITDIKVQIGASEATSLTPDENKSVTITIPEVEKATVSADGVITSGDEAKLVTATGAQNIAKKEASDAITAAVADGSVIDTRIDEVITAATLADGEKIATTTDTTKLVTVEDVTTYVSENAKVTLTQGTGITVTPNGEASTAFTVAVDDTVATAQSVTDLAGRVSETEDAIESLTTGDNSVASQIANATLSATSTGGDKVTVTLGGTVSAPTLTVDESDIASAQTLNEVKNTADTAVQSASGDTYVSAEKEADTTNIKVTTNIEAITAAVDDALVVEGTAVATAIAAAASASTALGSTTITSNDTDTGIKVELGGTVAAPTVDVTVTAATLSNDNKSFTTETSSNFAKASDVVTVATTIADEKVASIETTETAEIAASSESTSTKLATEASVAKSLATIEGKITGKNVGVTAGAETVGLSASDNTIGITTATYTVNEAEDTVGTWTNESYLVTGGTVKDAIVDAAAKALDDAKAYADGLHSTNLVYVVLGDSESLPPASAETLGKIYLVKEGNYAQGETSIDAISGSYVEYMTRWEDNSQDGEYVWEKIGTTATDLAGYAKTITINGETKTVSANGVNLGKAATSVTAGNGITSGSVSDTGALSLILDEGNTNKKGIVQLASTHDANDTNKAATGATVAAAIDALEATDIGNGAVKVSQTDGIVTSVTVETESLVSEDAIIDATTSTTALITAADALEAIKLAKPENYVASVTGYNADGESVTTTQGATVKVLDGRETVTEKDVWGTTVTMTDDGVITVNNKFVNNPNIENCAAWDDPHFTIVAVKDNKAYTSCTSATKTIYVPTINDNHELIRDNDGNIIFDEIEVRTYDCPENAFEANIQTDRIVDGSYMFFDERNIDNLKSFESSLKNLKNGQWMFRRCNKMDNFVSDLSSLENGDFMFTYTPKLEKFDTPMPKLNRAEWMFRHSGIKSFDVTELPSLVDGNNMFNLALQLKGDIKIDMPKLKNGERMFYHCKGGEEKDSSGNVVLKGDGIGITSFTGDLSSLTNGKEMFIECVGLKTFDSKVPSLENGNSMFNGCNSLTEFTGDLSSLTNGYQMFRGCTSLTEFTGDLSSLTNGYQMFYNCTSLTEFTGDLSSLTNGDHMFYCTSLTEFTGDLSSLTNGDYMFYSCTSLTEFTGDLSSLTNGDHMFRGCTSLTEFTGDLSSLTDGSEMFFYTPIDSFNGDLSSLTNGYRMFYNCTSLTEFTGDLSSLTNGQEMFHGCRLLNDFTGDLSSLTNGYQMFRGCNSLTEFTGDLSSLTNGSEMFYNCTSLTEFTGDLSSLTNGYRMFIRCTNLRNVEFESLESLTNGYLMFFNIGGLNTETIKKIADTIKDVRALENSKDASGNEINDGEINKKIHIKLESTKTDEDDEAFRKIANKGWDVYVNTAILTYPGANINPTSETGEYNYVPVAFWAKPISSNENEGEYVNKNGEFFNIIGGNYIYVSDPETYGQFISLEDAATQMGLTKYVKHEVTEEA